MTRDNNNDIFNAFNLGRLLTPFSRVGEVATVGASESLNLIDDDADFFKFNLDTTSKLEISLSGVPSGPGTAVLVELIRNANNSRFGDVGEIIHQVIFPGGGPLLSLDGVGPGEYIIRTSMSQGTSANYNLNVRATAGFGQEREPNNFRSIVASDYLESLNGTRNFSGGRVSESDPVDVYSFTVLTPSRFDATLIPTGSNADFRLVDEDGNVLVSSTKGGTNIDSLTFDYLKGNYFLEVFKPDLGTANYNLTLKAEPIAKAEMTVTVESVFGISLFETFGAFGDRPDFFVESITIEGGRSGRSKTLDNQRFAVFNFPFTRSVNVNDQDINARVVIKEDDTPFPAQVVDVFPVGGSEDLVFSYNPLTNEVNRGFGGIGPRIIEGREGESIDVTGEGSNFFGTPTPFDPFPDRAELRFRVDYNTFGFGSSSAFNLSSTPVTQGNNRNNTIRGRRRNGIIDGGGGRDNLSGMGGNDVLCGDRGRDTMDGGRGRDITYGAQGRDIHIGGQGRDTFVLDLERGVDVIKDFQNNRDKLGLTNAMIYDLLDIRKEGGNVGIYAGEQKLAVLENVRRRQINAQDFVQVGFATVQGIETPYAIA